MNKAAPAKKLKELLPVDASVGGVVVSRLQLDSRSVTAGDLFIALPGYTIDGREFIHDALEKGAVAVLAEAQGYSDVRQAQYPANVIWVEELRSQLGGIADSFYYSPSQSMRVFAVTGTNGKTTVSHLLTRLCALLGEPAAAIGTLGYGHPDQLVSLGNTTPDVITLHRILRELQDSGIASVAMEASSHGLDQSRLDSVTIHTAIATNLSHDHLDYHLTMDAYFEAKARLARWPGLRHLVINQDDAWIRKMAELAEADVKVVRFSMNPAENADVQLLASTYESDGIRMDVRVGDQCYSARTSLMGEFNIANILAVTAALWVEGFDIAAMFRLLENIPPVTGRMECLPHANRSAPVVVVDYAHTPDALAQALKSLRFHCRNRRLWCVFGCGGNRDKSKRPLMGKIAEDLADQVVVTTDNPRNELAAQILDEICAGITNRENIHVISDRAAAIAFAIQSAGEGDVVLLAGKGHENYQEIAGQRHYFSDHEVAMAALENRVGELRGMA